MHFNDLVGAFLLPKVGVRELLHHVSPLVLHLVLHLLPLVIDLNSTEVWLPMGAACHWKRTLPH